MPKNAAAPVENGKRQALQTLSNQSQGSTLRALLEQGVSPAREVELIPGRLSLALQKDGHRDTASSKEIPERFYFSSDLHESYQPLNSDFGPVNLGTVMRFCRHVQAFFKDSQLRDRHLMYECDTEVAHATNAAFLLGSYLVLVEKWSARKAARPFEAVKHSHLKPFRDATDVPSTFDLQLVDCLKGIQLAVESGFLTPHNFDITEYEQLADAEGADAHIICPKFLAFRGPSDDEAQQDVHVGYPPSTYIPLCQFLKVSTVVRLNEARYDKRAFEAAGMHHCDLIFDDCTSPSEDIVRRFLRICDAAPGMVAVHCYAGLGRTGTLIAAWIMKKYGWTAREAIGWVRIVRPGSVIGPQQHFLEGWERSLRQLSGSSSVGEYIRMAQSTQGHSALIAAQVTSAADRKRLDGATLRTGGRDCSREVWRVVT